MDAHYEMFVTYLAFGGGLFLGVLCCFLLLVSDVVEPDELLLPLRPAPFGIGGKGSFFLEQSNMMD